MKTPSRPGALLPVADYHGTLAAVRSLGRAGIDVTVADGRALVAARWSRYTARCVDCPDPMTEPGAFIGWLLETGAKEPGRVLLPTTDDLAWLFARHAAELRRHWVLDAPSLGAVYTVLNKWRLGEAAAAVGIDAPKTWLPSEAQLDGEGLPFPLLIKPQTQTMLLPHQKGRVVRAREDLRALHADFMTQTKHGALLLESDPQATRPMLQELVESRGIYGLSGFIDATGERFVVSASRKVLQRPQVLGIGLCFQHAKVDEALAGRLRDLCRRIGYHGMFEVEFLEQAGRHLIIDFNPRCYGQMALDIARGADLPLLAYLHAIKDEAALETEVELAKRRLAAGGARSWCDRIAMELFINLRRLTGHIDRPTANTWKTWLEAHRHHLIDPVLDADDWKPGVVAVLQSAWSHVKHPRATWRALSEA
ncbi:MAG: carbamoyl-phosphate synthase [Myxococcaceae bacterium]|nr:carbamoyl-phosphate synthase [Myxococcaceae bacterium]